MSRPEPVLRPAGRADLPAIVALLADDEFSRGREGGAEDAVAAAFDEIERDPNNHVWVVEIGARLVGCAQLTVIPGLSRRGLKRAQVEGVRIASDLRGRGIGRRLMAGLLEQARAAGCGVVQLTTNKRRTDAHRFYRSLGFEMVHEAFQLVLED